jgi:bifunctional non-homologous end joining protein LigD
MSARTQLERYREMRDFTRTPEPAGGEGRPAGRSFVVQKHDASHLHYDFRLELGGTLKSWAVPKGPSLDPDDKRLAMEVEDHPVEYGGFEGAIPKGQYGGGTVALWDRGWWEPVAKDGKEPDPGKDLSKGKLHFVLHGQKLAGEWILIRTSRGDAKKPQWLLRKLEDDHARPDADYDVLEERPESVASGLTIEELTESPPRVWQSDRQGDGRRRWDDELAELAGAKEAKLPRFVAPQLATAVDQPPSSEGGGTSGGKWIHEIKLDGYRILCRIEGGEARLVSRNEKDWTGRFPAVASEAPFLPVSEALLDGEIVWLTPDGRSDFQALQSSLEESTGPAIRNRAPIYYVAFDLLHLDGHDLTRVPLRERKELLRHLLEAAGAGTPHLRFGDHVEGLGGQGAAFYRHACEMELEGVIAKRADRPYRSRRSRDWLKIKCTGRQEMVIVGWTDPSGSRTGFGSLLLAFHDEEGKLTYAGKVGTGFDRRTLEDLRERLDRLARKTSPLDAGLDRVEKGVHWVTPKLVAEIAFTEWTRDGALRHPSFQGLREDKAPEEVRRERAKPVDEVAAAGQNRRAEKGGGPMPKKAKETKKKRSTTEGEVAGVRVTSLDRELYPKSSAGPAITKGDLVDYYHRVAERMLPHVADRPLTLLRCPGGIEAESNKCFYQRHLGEGPPEALHGVDFTEESGETETYLLIRDEAGLVSLAQLGVLEIHPWASRSDRLERPDRLIFDLDPDPSVGWKEVVASAHDLRELLEGLELRSWIRTTGGKGVHVVIPIRRDLDFDQAKALTRGIAELMAEREPDRYTTNIRKAKRKGRIFVDYLRNAQTATAIGSYSTRARPGAPVATPLTWDELTPDLDPQSLNLRTLPGRLEQLKKDPWAELLTTPQRIKKEILTSLGVEKE